MDLNDENLVFTPFDVIAPIPGKQRGRGIDQYFVGCKLEPNVLTTAKVEVYYKKLNNLAAVNLEKVYDWENDYIFGSGEAYGVDLSYTYDAERTYTGRWGILIAGQHGRLTAIRIPYLPV